MYAGIFSANTVFWAYCANRKDLVKITPNSFPALKVWQVISACLSIKPIHGEFTFEDYRFSDPIYSPMAKMLTKKILKNSDNHLFLNYKKSQISRNVIFLRYQPYRFPTLSLAHDFFTFACNIRNQRLIKTHQNNVAMLHNGAQQQRGVLQESEALQRD